MGEPYRLLRVGGGGSRLSEAVSIVVVSLNGRRATTDRGAEHRHTRSETKQTLTSGTEPRFAPEAKTSAADLNEEVLLRTGSGGTRDTKTKSWCSRLLGRISMPSALRPDKYLIRGGSRTKSKQNRRGDADKTP